MVDLWMPIMEYKYDVYDVSMLIDIKIGSEPDC